MKTIAERLTYARGEIVKLSQEELAQRAGVSQGTIGNIESGLRKNPRELLAIAKAAGVHAEWLKNGKGPMRLTESAVPAPPPVAHRFQDRHEVSETDWALLQDIKTVLGPEEIRSIRERAKAAHERALAIIEERKGK